MFAKGTPQWVAPCQFVLYAIAVAQFAWVGFRSGPGLPAILDGRYVIEARGHVFKVISPVEYLALRATLLRMAAAFMAAVYFLPMMYWWRRGKD